MIEIICIAFGVLGVLFGIRCYHELWKWASMCNNVRIAIAFKSKVKMDYPLTEFIKMTNLMDKDKDSTGRVFYMQGGTRIALVKRYYGEWTWRRWFKAVIATKKRQPAPAKQGTYKTKDQTPQQNKIKAVG